MTEEHPSQESIVLAQVSHKIDQDEIIGMKTLKQFWFIFLCKILLIINCIISFQILSVNSRPENAHLDFKKR